MLESFLHTPSTRCSVDHFVPVTPNAKWRRFWESLPNGENSRTLLQSTNLMDGLSTKVQDHKFPKPKIELKLLYLKGERQEGRWAERRPKGFAEVREILKKMLLKRYAPVHKLLHKTLDTTRHGTTEVCGKATPWTRTRAKYKRGKET